MTTADNVFTARNRVTVDEKYTKTYATIDNLNKALIKLGFQQYRHILVGTETGRWTAVFIDEKANPVIFQGFIWAR